MQLGDFRKLIPGIDDCSYFQTSGFSPKPQPVLEEVIASLHLQSRGPAIDEIHEAMQRRSEAVRSRLAQLIQADPDEIMLNENATIGINIVAQGISWRAGDNLILSNHEHPGNRIPWYQLKTQGLELRFLEAHNDAEQMLEDFAHLLDRRTRLVSISHVSRRSGLRFPVNRLIEQARQKGIPVLLDGAQAVGAIPVDVKVLNCDFYTLSGHKYLMGPQATGALYVRQDRIAWLKPSWLGSHSQEIMDMIGNMKLHDSARRFEFGTRNLADQAGLGKALELWQSIGWDKVFAYLAAYTHTLKIALQDIPGLILETPLAYSQSSGIVSFHLPNFKAAGIQKSLWDRERVLVSTLEGNDHSIRVSAHVFNTDEDRERLLAGLGRIQARGC
ncbi:MAG: aminotransferase class V-fold PLP-dependent enzyme [Trueperaceae bacterium]|nr:MAG: aminotransferase class V-fold PLP-dependent enzyme [Trueperaceae bacterium]